MLIHAFQDWELKLRLLFFLISTFFDLLYSNFPFPVEVRMKYVGGWYGLENLRSNHLMGEYDGPITFSEIPFERF